MAGAKGAQRATRHQSVPSARNFADLRSSRAEAMQTRTCWTPAQWLGPSTAGIGNRLSSARSSR